MIPDANTIVNSLLVREGLDDPERYISWLKTKASAKALRDIGFGAAISTSDNDVIQINAQERGIDLDNPVTNRATLEQDLALIEANGLAILRRMGLFLQDEGHGIDGDRVTSAWISVDNEDTARNLAAKALSLARDQNSEPASTSNGTLNALMPDAERLIWQNVSEMGQSLIDVMVYFFDTEKLAEWAAIAHVEESAEMPPDDPISYLNQTFDIKDILRGYEHVPVNNYWWKELRYDWPRVNMEIQVRRRGYTVQDDANTLYDIEILRHEGNGQVMHCFTAYSVKLIELRKAVKLAEEAAATGNYALLGDYSLSNERRFRNESVDEPPPEDDPEAVLNVHRHSLLVPEMKRLGFKVGKDKSTVRFFDEEVPRFMVKSYTAADGSKHGVYVYIIHVLSGGNEFKVNNFDAANNCWYMQGAASDISVNCQTTAQSGAAVRDLDAAMKRSAEMSLPVDQEHAMLQRVASHYSMWYWDSMWPAHPPQG